MSEPLDIQLVTVVSQRTMPHPCVGFANFSEELQICISIDPDKVDPIAQMNKAQSLCDSMLDQQITRRADILRGEHERAQQRIADQMREREEARQAKWQQAKIDALEAELKRLKGEPVEVKPFGATTLSFSDKNGYHTSPSYGTTAQGDGAEVPF